MMMTDQQRDVVSVVATGVLMFCVYSMVAPAALCGADNAEFVTLSVTQGVAHPPGYPLYTLYLRAMSWLPGLTTAHTAATATAILGAAAIAMLNWAARRWGASRLAATLAALLVGVEPHVMAAHTHAEVFALNHLVAAAILAAAAPHSNHPTRTAALLGLLAGLGLSNHHSIVLLAPVGLWAVFNCVRASRHRVIALTAAVACAALGLAPYATLIAAPECVDCLSWGQLNDVQDIWHHFIRGDYGSTTLGVRGDAAGNAHLAAFGRALFFTSSAVVALIGAAGAFWMLRVDRGGAVILIVTWVLCGPVFVRMFNTPLEGIGTDIVSRFYSLPIIVLGLFVAQFLAAVPRRVSLIAVPVVALLAGVNGDAANKECTGVLDAYARDLLEPLPPDAVLFGTGDHRTFGAAYMQYAEGVRTDVDWIDARMLAYDWYVERLETRLGRPLPRSTADEIPLTAFVVSALETGRPVFVSHVFAPAVRSYRSHPIGPVIRIHGSTSNPPPPSVLAEQNAKLLDQLALDADGDAITNPWEREVLQHYARPWVSLAHAFEQTGDEESAARARQLAAEFE